MPILANAQEASSSTDPNRVPRNESAFISQITPQSVAEARAAEQQQLERAAAPDEEVAQLSQEGEGASTTQQLSDGDSARALAQLSPAERQVLLDAVEGTDICDRTTNIPAIKALCDGRIETRSAEFRAERSDGSAEDSLLGGRFDAERVATLEAAISRLARGTGGAEDFSDQAVASVALTQQSAGAAQAGAGESDPTKDLSPETQTLVNAIVQQFGGS